MSDANATETTKEPKVTVASIIRAGLTAGDSDEAILAAVREQLPDAKTGSNSVAYYRSQMRKNGDLPAFVRAPKKAAEGDAPAAEEPAAEE